MSGELIVLTGDTSTGKSTWASKWRAEFPGRRHVTGDVDEALLWLRHGFDVALDNELLAGFTVTVKRFNTVPLGAPWGVPE